jgi:multiple sugar transport system permease protein
MNARLVRPKWLTVHFSISLKHREWIAAYIFLAPFLIFFTIFFLRAVVKAVDYSFTDWRLLRPKINDVGFDNYRELFDDEIWWNSLKNTIYFAAMTVTGTTVVGLSAALAVTQKNRGQGFFRVLLMPSLLSVGAVGLVWGWLLSTQFGVINYGLSAFWNQADQLAG